MRRNGRKRSESVHIRETSSGARRQGSGSLEGSLIMRSLEAGENVCRFKHPTIRDAFGGLIGDGPNLMDIFLRGTRVEQLISEITCGDVGLKGVKLVVPPDRFRLVTDRF